MFSYKGVQKGSLKSNERVNRIVRGVVSVQL